MKYLDDVWLVQADGGIMGPASTRLELDFTPFQVLTVLLWVRAPAMRK
jgi:hypothetical protein